MYCTHKSSILCNILGFLIITAIVLAGCSEPEIDNDFLDDLVDAEAVYFETIGQGSRASFSELTELVVKDSVSWALYQKKMATVLPFQSINFSRLMVAFAAVPSANGGVTIQFESAERIEGELVLNYVIGVPGLDCRIIDMPSVPFQAIIIRKMELPVKFEYREEPQSCTLE